MARKTKEACIWIIDILRKQKIPFQIIGGFAANIYGSKRPLADIDIGVPDKKVTEVQKYVQKYITYGPQQYKDNEWDLLLMTLQYKGQEIDIFGVDSQKICHRQTGTWVRLQIDFSQSTKKRVYNHMLPIIPVKDLIRYKKKLRRDVDIQDIEAVSK